MSEQPKASVQYQDYKKWPKTYREPTSEEWDKELSDLRTQLAEAQGEIGRMNISLELQADRVDKLIDENVKAEAENAALRERLKPVEEVYDNYNHGKGLYCDMQVICDLWQAIKAACEKGE